MASSTPATKALEKAKIAFTPVTYEYAPAGEKVGLQAAEAIGVDPSMIFKTLMIELDSKPVCAIVPSDSEVNMKKLAKALKGKSAVMMDPQKAERMTGYKVGGISPLGQRKSIPSALDQTALEHEEIHINGGQRGLQLRLNGKDLKDVLGCVVGDLTR